MRLGSLFAISVDCLQLCALSKLTTLEPRGNCPSLRSSLYKLEYLYLDNNELSDAVPGELGRLNNLKRLSLHNNDLVGEVGAPICKLSDELFLAQLTADCGGDVPEVSCDCCSCNDREPIVHLGGDEGRR